jgi:hypothetical protein
MTEATPVPCEYPQVPGEEQTGGEMLAELL